MTNFFDNGYAYEGQLILCPNCNRPAQFKEYLDEPGGYLKVEKCSKCSFEVNYPSKNSLQLYNRVVYEAKCEGHKLMVLTQPDRSPEYATAVTVICPIHGNEIVFTLPVN